MSSPPKEKAETRAGHPPAVKAGGMRIVQKHPHNSEDKEGKDKDDHTWETSSPPKPTVLISGVVARGDKDFPPAAAQVAHQKPHPSVEKLPHPQHIKQHIHQPRKVLSRDEGRSVYPSQTVTDGALELLGPSGCSSPAGAEQQRGRRGHGQHRSWG